jgi:hypothetical protein
LCIDVDSNRATCPTGEPETKRIKAGRRDAPRPVRERSGTPELLRA